MVDNVYMPNLASPEEGEGSLYYNDRFTDYDTKENNNAWDIATATISEPAYHFAKGFFSIIDGLGDSLLGLASLGFKTFGRKDVANDLNKAINYDLAGALAKLTSNSTTYGISNLFKNIGEAISTGDIGVIGKSFDLTSTAIDQWEKDLYQTNVLYKISDGKGVLDTFHKGVNDLASGVGQIAFTAILPVGKASQAVAKGIRVGTLAASAMGHGINEALQDGADINKAVLYGGATGIVEGATEYAFDFVGLLGNTGKKIKNFFPNSINGLFAEKIGKSILGDVAKGFIEEGTEEVLSDLANPLLKSIYNGKSVGENYSELKGSDVAYSFLMGGLTSAVMGSPDVIKRARLHQNGRNFVYEIKNNATDLQNKLLELHNNDKIINKNIDGTYEFSKEGIDTFNEFKTLQDNLQETYNKLTDKEKERVLNYLEEEGIVEYTKQLEEKYNKNRSDLSLKNELEKHRELLAKNIDRVLDIDLQRTITRHSDFYNIINTNDIIRFQKLLKVQKLDNVDITVANTIEEYNELSRQSNTSEETSALHIVENGKHSIVFNPQFVGERAKTYIHETEHVLQDNNDFRVEEVYKKIIEKSETDTATRELLEESRRTIYENYKIPPILTYGKTLNIEDFNDTKSYLNYLKKPLSYKEYVKLTGQSAEMIYELYKAQAVVKWNEYIHSYNRELLATIKENLVNDMKSLEKYVVKNKAGNKTLKKIYDTKTLEKKNKKIRKAIEARALNGNEIVANTKKQLNPDMFIEVKNRWSEDINSLQENFNENNAVNLINQGNKFCDIVINTTSNTINDLGDNLSRDNLKSINDTFHKFDKEAHNSLKMLLEIKPLIENSLTSKEASFASANDLSNNTSLILEKYKTFETNYELFKKQMETLGKEIADKLKIATIKEEQLSKEKVEVYSDSEIKELYNKIYENSKEIENKNYREITRNADYTKLFEELRKVNDNSSILKFSLTNAKLNYKKFIIEYSKNKYMIVAINGDNIQGKYFISNILSSEGIYNKNYNVEMSSALREFIDNYCVANDKGELGIGANLIVNEKYNGQFADHLFKNADFTKTYENNDTKARYYSFNPYNFNNLKITETSTASGMYSNSIKMSVAFNKGYVNKKHLSIEEKENIKFLEKNKVKEEVSKKEKVKKINKEIENKLDKHIKLPQSVFIDTNISKRNINALEPNRNAIKKDINKMINDFDNSENTYEQKKIGKEISSYLKDNIRNNDELIKLQTLLTDDKAALNRLLKNAKVDDADACCQFLRNSHHIAQNFATEGIKHNSVSLQDINDIAYEIEQEHKGTYSTFEIHQMLNAYLVDYLGIDRNNALLVYTNQYLEKNNFKERITFEENETPRKEEILKKLKKIKDLDLLDFNKNVNLEVKQLYGKQFNLKAFLQISANSSLRQQIDKCYPNLFNELSQIKEDTILEEHFKQILEATEQNKEIDDKKIKKDLKGYIFTYSNQQYLDDIKKIEDKLGKEKVQEFQKRVYTYATDLRNYMVENELLSKSSAEQMELLYPHYVPTNRELVRSGSGVSFNQNTSNVVHGAKGSSQVIQDVLVSLYENTHRAVKANATNYVLNQLNNNMILNSSQMKINKFLTIDKNGKRTYENNDYIPKNLSIDDIERDNYNEHAVYNLFQHTLDNNTIIFTNIDKNGNQNFYKATMSDLVYKAFSGRQNIINSNILKKTFAGSTSLFKNLVTSYNPFFIVRNLARDLPDALLTSKHKMGDFVRELKNSYGEIFNNNDKFKSYLEYGGTTSTEYQGFVESVNKISKQRASNIRSTYQKYSIARMNFIVEQATRFTEYKLSYENYIKKGYPIKDAHIKAINDSAEITTNFARGGTLTKMADKYFMPFINAQVQGACKLEKFIMRPRDLKDWSGLLLRLLLLGILPSLFNELAYKDDDDYQSLSEYTKEQYYLIKVNNGKFIKVPKGRMVGSLNSFARQAMNIIKKEKNLSEASKTALKTTWSNLSPLENGFELRTMLSPINDSKKNLTWYGSQIDNASDLRKFESERYDSKTGQIAKSIGQTFNVSPKRVQYLLEQYTGIVGDILLPLNSNQSNSSVIQNLSLITKNNTSIDSVNNNKYYRKVYDLKTRLTYESSANDPISTMQLKYLNKAMKELKELEDKVNSATTDYERYTAYLVLRNAYKQVIQNTHNLRNALSNIVIGEEEDKFALANAYKQVIGAEYALKEYNAGVYQKAKKCNEFGIDYDTFFETYFNLRYTNSIPKQKAYIRQLGLSWYQTLYLYKCVGGRLEQDNEENLKRYMERNGYEY